MSLFQGLSYYYRITEFKYFTIHLKNLKYVNSFEKKKQIKTRI